MHYIEETNLLQELPEGHPELDPVVDPTQLYNAQQGNHN